MTAHHESNLQLWFDRKFDFTFPVEQFPNLSCGCVARRRDWRTSFAVYHATR